jgi:hypothetical protein
MEKASCATLAMYTLLHYFPSQPCNPEVVEGV